MSDQQATEIAPLSLEEILRALDENPASLTDYFALLHSVELGEMIIACRDDATRARLVALIPEQLLGETLLELPEGMREDLLADFAPSAIGSVVEHMDSDDAADLLQVVDDDVVSSVIEQMDPDDRRGMEALLSHEEESAGGLMQAELFKVRAEWPVGKVLEVLRRWGREIDNLNYVYVVDDESRLVGVTPLHQLLFCEPDTAMESITDKNFPRVHAGQDQEEVAILFDKYAVLAVPVVDEHGELIGRITADDILEVVQEEATEDMYRLAGLSDQDDLAEPVGITAWRRGVWLGVNLLTAILASVVISQFEATIAQIVALAVLMPIVASMGGIAGTQTLTVIVRGIALGRVTFDNAKRALIKETMVSVVTGMSFALLIGSVAAWWFPELGYRLGLIIAAAMLINLMAAGLAGSLIPLTLQRINIDPALASGTILTTVTDVVGFLTFLGLATIFLL